MRLLAKGCRTDPPGQATRFLPVAFALNKEKMIVVGMFEEDASKLLSTLIGAIVVANALSDSTEYDRATGRGTGHAMATAA